MIFGKTKAGYYSLIFSTKKSEKAVVYFFEPIPIDKNATKENGPWFYVRGEVPKENVEEYLTPLDIQDNLNIVLEALEKIIISIFNK